VESTEVFRDEMLSLFLAFVRANVGMCVYGIQKLYDYAIWLCFIGIGYFYPNPVMGGKRPRG